MIFFEPISPARMKDYTDKVKELDRLLIKKIVLESRLSNVKGVDYSALKVITGNGKKISAQEHFVQKLERLNKEIDFLKYRIFGPYGLVEEHEIIKMQISRISKIRYAKLLVWRYLEKWKWKDIVAEFFEEKDDFVYGAKDKYWDLVMYWHTRALKELEEISAKPYVPIQRTHIREDENVKHTRNKPSGSPEQSLEETK